MVRPETTSHRYQYFIDPVLNLAAAHTGITVRGLTDLHAKIYAGQHGALYGSLNLTESGIERNLEFGAYYSDTRNTARLQAEAQSLFESAEELS